METVNVNNIGIELLDGTFYKWSEVSVILRFEAIIGLDTKPEPLTILSSSFDGEDGRELLVSLLRATCPEIHGERQGNEFSA